MEQEEGVIVTHFKKNKSLYFGAVLLLLFGISTYVMIGITTQKNTLELLNISTEEKWNYGWFCIEWDLQDEMHYRNICNKPGNILILDDYRGAICIDNGNQTELAHKCTKQIIGRKRM